MGARKREHGIYVYICNTILKENIVNNSKQLNREVLVHLGEEFHVKRGWMDNGYTKVTGWAHIIWWVISEDLLGNSHRFG